MISEKDCIVFDDWRLSEIFNTHFVNITKTLDLKPGIISTTTILPEIIETLKDQSSIKEIFLCEGGCVSSSFILWEKMKLERLF